MTKPTKSTPRPWTGALADSVFEAVKAYIDRRDAEFVPLLKGLHEALMSTAAGETKRRVERHAEHLARLESRIQKLERSTK